MRIREIRQVTVPLAGGVSNAVVSFDDHTVSFVAVVSDLIRDGRPLVGLAFNSIGRFAQPGILEGRMIPRVLEADPASLREGDEPCPSPALVAKAAMRNEKPGGHGDRAGAAAALELAIWDLRAKVKDEPAHATIARHFGREVARRPSPVYAAGGYYYPEGSLEKLRGELQGYRAQGFEAFKMKIGGASLDEDLRRIEAALEIAGEGARLSVDANGRFDLERGLAYARRIAPLKLRWYEEVGDPLDFALNRALVEQYEGPVATGENLFSLQDVENLLRYAGLRPGRDIFQMDAGLSYGLTEYGRMIEMLEAHGFDRAQAYPHGGHLINLHIAVGLGLGGCEAYPGVFQPFGGYSPQCEIAGGLVWPSDAPGFGLEQKTELKPYIEELKA
jgi:L-alanine-DL-glutamate epimerase-like enolase superfamily enzyme